MKIPRFAFEKFPGADPTLTIQMKSVGETMAIGRTFTEALQKGLRGLEVGKAGWEIAGTRSREELQQQLAIPTAERIFQLKAAFQVGFSVEELYAITKIDRVDSSRVEQVRAELDALLAGTSLASIAALPV